MSVELYQTARPLRKFLATDSTASSFVTLTDQADDPFLNLATVSTTDETGSSTDNTLGRPTPMWILLYPVCVGTDEDTFDLRIIGWSRIAPTVAALGQRYQWTYSVLGEFHVTLGTATGLAGGTVGSTYLYADTITIVTQELTTDLITTSGTIARGGDWIVSPALNLKAYIKAPVDGHERIQIDFQRTGGKTPSMNTLFRFMEF